MARTREFRRKIKSVKNIRQITKAMELVAASKMRRAVAMTLAIRPYATLAHRMLQNVSDAVGEEFHALLKRRAIKKVLVLLLATDRGLCGGLNTQLFRRVGEYIQEEWKKGTPPELHFVAIGKKAMDFLRRGRQTVVASFSSLSAHPSFRDVLPISRLILDDYESEQYDKVMLCYMDFKSVMVQRPVVRRLLPLSRKALEEMMEPIPVDIPSTTSSVREYLFEPQATTVLQYLLPRLTEMQIYQAILEATASEHSARMFAMRSATENANEVIGDLTLAYNSVRQASITAEIAEISAGMTAMQ